MLSPNIDIKMHLDIYIYIYRPAFVSKAHAKKRGDTWPVLAKQGTITSTHASTEPDGEAHHQSSKQSIKHTINQIKQSAKKENKQTRRRNLILKN